ncbi:MAG: hypothetical protein Q9202_006240 [Teloschistes flavicans]
MSRISTYSLFTALGILGYKTYPATELRNILPSIFALWTEALTVKYPSHTHGPKAFDLPKAKYGRPEFDKLLAGYTTVTGILYNMFRQGTPSCGSRRQSVGHDEEREVLGVEREMGWGPLCEYLVKRVPENGMEYPNLNDLKGVIGFLGALWWAAARKLAVDLGRSVGLPLVEVVAAAVAWSRLRNRR